MIAALFSVLLLATETPAASAEAVSSPTQEAPQPPAEPSKKAEKKICRVDPANTGSRMRKNLCLTQTEWANRAAGKNAGDLKTLGAH